MSMGLFQYTEAYKQAMANGKNRHLTQTEIHILPISIEIGIFQQKLKFHEIGFIRPLSMHAY